MVTEIEQRVCPDCGKIVGARATRCHGCANRLTWAQRKAGTLVPRKSSALCSDCSRPIGLEATRCRGCANRRKNGLNRKFTLDSYSIHESGCWIWQGSQNSEGYGSYWNGSKLVSAHVAIYERLRGPVPDGMELDHVRERGCMHRHCVNPDHLEPVPHSVNSQRGNVARVSVQDVQTIRSLEGTMTQEKIAAMFGITQGTVSHIILRKTWKNVP